METYGELAQYIPTFTDETPADPFTPEFVSYAAWWLGKPRLALAFLY